VGVKLWSPKKSKKTDFGQKTKKILETGLSFGVVSGTIWPEMLTICVLEPKTFRIGCQDADIWYKHICLIQPFYFPQKHVMHFTWIVSEKLKFEFLRNEAVLREILGPTKNWRIRGQHLQVNRIPYWCVGVKLWSPKKVKKDGFRSKNENFKKNLETGLSFGVVSGTIRPGILKICLLEPKTLGIRCQDADIWYKHICLIQPFSFPQKHVMHFKWIVS